MKTTVIRCFALLALALAFITANGWADAATDFKTRCAPCHGPSGAGDTKLGEHLHVPNLASAEVQKQSDADLYQVILKGKGGKMPPNEGKLSKEEINDLVKYIRSLKK